MTKLDKSLAQSWLEIRAKERRKSRKLRKGIAISVLVFFCLYILILKFPQFLFSNKIHRDSFTIHSTSKIPDAIHQLIDIVEARIRESEFYKGDLKHNLYICNNRYLYSFLSYPTKTTFASNNVITRNIIIAEADIENNLSCRIRDDKTRSLDNLITHEVTHNLLFEYLGIKDYFKLAHWKNEGYSDFVAGASTVTGTEEIIMICSNQDPKSYSYYRLAIEHLIEKEGYTMKEVIASSIDYDALIEKVKLSICPQKQQMR